MIEKLTNKICYDETGKPLYVMPPSKEAIIQKINEIIELVNNVLIRPAVTEEKPYTPPKRYSGMPIAVAYGVQSDTEIFTSGIASNDSSTSSKEQNANTHTY